ncbi:hypothetical protein [Bifidobacterium pseudolongum]|uniref:hypothetical protein n=1 Tax=Bifidobacterium pseudolongum TaxID=1694 RepID=UPI001020B59B|nr:hypothetical protein [Bifidobacterium pseudolongum]RYQ33999.1 hypothetical protein PG2004B_0862 [Bifidobacterium pseudolongum subsp. globosum]
MNNLEDVVTIVVAIAGCSGFWEWWRARQEKHQQAVTRGELEELIETSLRNSASIRELREKIDHNTVAIAESHEWHKRHEEETHKHRLLGLRQALMQDPRDRLAHEHQLEAGREYLAAGGNGIGHTRYEQLLADYKWWLAHSDWDYTHRPPTTNTDQGHGK